MSIVAETTGTTVSELTHELKAASLIINKLSRIARYYAGDNGTKIGRGRWDFPPLRRAERKAVLDSIARHDEMVDYMRETRGRKPRRSR